ncbi:MULTISPECIES: RagB/SusD family nutrient uptake outer membrane protein [Parabacteroides]|uniref:RagB/SusD family nutrient uptake outer membrane protein n=1 Tax=Parabacteroides timonensis TaxID=1871013 RepID=UPI00094E8CC1|nr:MULTISPECIES: RagB/SusD family nutrient uptake outer membrane protein [Parabacteroides]
MKRTVKQFYIFALSGLLLAGGTSCEDFLEENPKTNFSQDSYFQNINQAKTAVDGAYERLRALQAYDGYGEGPWVTLELLCGHATTLGQSTYNNGYIRHTTGTNSPSFKNIWEGFYEGIADCNMCITGIQKVSGDTKSLLGEVHTLRALYYFYLVRLYGDIPLILEPVTADSELLYPERATKEKVFESILSDLKLAEQSGLPETDRTGRVSLGLVKTIMADVYQYMAGAPLNKGAEYYKLAYEKAKEVLDKSYCVSPASADYNASAAGSAWYSLFDSYEKLHDDENKNRGELIFQIQYKEGITTNQITSMIVPTMKQIIKIYDEFGALMPTWDFYNSYEKGDKRTEEKEMFFTKDGHRDDKTNIIEFGSPALYKYYDIEGALKTGLCDINFTLYRLPEVMFIYAESYTQANGAPDQLSYDMVNAIRSRANLAPVAGLSKDDFLQAVWKERAHELCFENKDYFDIQRTRKAYNVKANSYDAYDGFANESGVTFDEKYLLWPIPSTETDANPKLLPNNPGW